MFTRIILSFCGLVAFCMGPTLAADLPVKAVSPVVSFAQRWYVEGRLGGPLLKSYDIAITGLGAGTYKPNSGFHGAVDIGYEFSPNWRAEAEFTWTQGRDGNVALGAANFPHSGTTDVYTFGVNGFYVFDFSQVIRPFVGAGVGAAVYKVRNLGAVGGGFVINDSKTTAVLALHAGVDVPITRSVTLTARYTLAHTGSMTFGSVPAGFATTRNSTFDNIFTGGLRVYLN